MSCCFRYKRKGSSSLGLQPGRQIITWEDSNKKSKVTSKKGADRYFSTVSRQLLSSQPPVPSLPVILEVSDVTSPTAFLPLGDDGENKEREPGRQIFLVESPTCLKRIHTYIKKVFSFLAKRVYTIVCEQIFFIVLFILE